VNSSSPFAICLPTFPCLEVEVEVESKIICLLVQLLVACCWRIGRFIFERSYMDKDPWQVEEPPPAIVVKKTTSMVSPLTNASVSSSKGTTIMARDALKSPPRSPSIRTTKTPPPRSPTIRTTKTPVRRSERLTNSARKRQKTSKGKKIAVTKDIEEAGDDESNYEEDPLSIEEEEEELPADDTVDMDDVDDARMVADVDQGSQSKQIKLKKKSIQFEKQHVVLAARTGRKISATAFAKGYFKMASITDAGAKLVNSKDGMLWILPLFFDGCVPYLFLTSLLPPLF
jgi:hypothetical protein